MKIDKILPVVLFWGLWILIVIWLMNRNHDESYRYDPYGPDPATERQEDFCPSGPC